VAAVTVRGIAGAARLAIKRRLVPEAGRAHKMASMWACVPPIAWAASSFNPKGVELQELTLIWLAWALPPMAHPLLTVAGVQIALILVMPVARLWRQKSVRG
jgi:hypothetical protein